MSYINNLAIAKKLYGFAAILLALMLIVGVLGIKNLNNVSDESSKAYTAATAPLAELGEARAKTNENRAFLNNHILEPGEAEQREIEAKIAKNADITNESLAAVEKTLQT